ncbi:unnamed protein product [Urochloa decumbens]|uniref:Uncharacterized protein n=1 Tax=Urochloa decumbens TaxID=240449 RepID=A0ABC8ZV21_9POAL
MGTLRRIAPAPFPSALPLSKRPRGAAPAARGATARDRSSTGRRVDGANQKVSSVPSCSKYTKAVRNGVVVEMEVIPAAGNGETLPGATLSSLKPTARGATARAASAHRASAAQKLPAPPGSKCIKAIANCGAMAGEKKPARRAGADEQFPVPDPKRVKVTRRDGAETTSAVDPALGTLRKRMAAELDFLHDLLRKAELLSSGKNGRCMAVADAKQRSEAPVEASIETAPAKRRKMSDLPKIAEFESTPEDKKGFVGIGGGASPVATPVVEKAGETSNNVGESREPPEEKNEFVDICDGVSPVVPEDKPCESRSSPSSSSDSGSSSSSDSDSDSDSGSSSSSSDSDSDSDSDSESDPDEPVVDIPVPLPPAVLPEENGATAQPPPEPAPEAAQSTELESVPGGGVGHMAPPALLPSRRASEVAQIAGPNKKVQDAPRATPEAVSITGVLYKAKTRRQLLEMRGRCYPTKASTSWTCGACASPSMAAPASCGSSGSILWSTRSARQARLQEQDSCKCTK